MLTSSKFFRLYNIKFVNPKKPGKFVIEGGVGFWKEQWITISKRDIQL